MPILDTKEDRRLRHLRDEHGTYSAAVIYSLETQLAESKADEWNAFIKRKQAEAIDYVLSDIEIMLWHGVEFVAVSNIEYYANTLRAEADAEGDTNEG